MPTSKISSARTLAVLRLENFFRGAKGTMSEQPHPRHSPCRCVIDVGNGLFLMRPLCVGSKQILMQHREKFPT
ncbi:hypothetical protein Csa_006352 [Cucumis sativus]|uniref:Uncharacterized protein n=1 Tax=Cucumis sativus TaxID=3659 RepID=A0A0A0LHL9_CUCSA|nr:hypothetical protein Csa_006352 [Cucumis sativus]